MISSLFPKLAVFRDSSVARFWVVVTVERIAITILLASICDLFGAAHRTDLDSLNTEKLVILSVFIAPLFETLLFQSFPYAIARACSLGLTLTLVFCWLPFAIVHLSSGMSTFVCAGLGSGYYLSQTYVRLRGTSFIVAYGLTAASHAVLNSMATVWMIYQRGW